MSRKTTVAEPLDGSKFDLVFDKNPFEPIGLANLERVLKSDQKDARSSFSFSVVLSEVELPSLSMIDELHLLKRVPKENQIVLPPITIGGSKSARDTIQIWKDSCHVEMEKISTIFLVLSTIRKEPPLKIISDYLKLFVADAATLLLMTLDDADCCIFQFNLKAIESKFEKVEAHDGWEKFKMFKEKEVVTLVSNAYGSFFNQTLKIWLKANVNQEYFEEAYLPTNRNSESLYEVEDKNEKILWKRCGDPIGRNGQVDIEKTLETDDMLDFRNPLSKNLQMLSLFGITENEPKFADFGPPIEEIKYLRWKSNVSNAKIPKFPQNFFPELVSLKIDRAYQGSLILNMSDFPSLQRLSIIKCLSNCRIKVDEKTVVRLTSLHLENYVGKIDNIPHWFIRTFFVVGENNSPDVQKLTARALFLYEDNVLVSSPDKEKREMFSKMYNIACFEVKQLLALNNENSKEIRENDVNCCYALCCFS